MSHQTAVMNRVSTIAWSIVVSLLLSILLPFVGTGNVHAAQLDNRSITMDSSQSGATDVMYSVSFDVGTTGNIAELVLQYCDTSPIIGDATCGDTRSFDWSNATLAIANQVGITDWTIDGAESDSNTLVLNRTAASVTAGTTVSFDLGTTAGAGDGVTNPTSDNTAFYVRLLTYATDAANDTYAPGTPGSNVDDGGIALSTAEQIEIDARVQERLTFCVGTADPGANCAGISGSTVDLGVLGSTINTAAGEANPGVAYAQVSTNAVNGVSVSYVAGTLKVGATDCSTVADTNKAVNDVKTDQCFNWHDDADTDGVMVGGDEQFGLAITSTPDDGTETTDNLLPTAAYNYDLANEWSFDPYEGTADSAVEIATSSTVVDSEQLNIDFAATASITTPTGLYETTFTFIATSTF